MLFYKPKQFSRLVYFAGPRAEGQGESQDLSEYVNRKSNSLCNCVPITGFYEFDAVTMLEDASQKIFQAPFTLRRGELELEVRKPDDFDGKTLQQLVFKFLPTGQVRGTAIKPDEIIEVIDVTKQKLLEQGQRKLKS